eukprot:jgi/Botrbrau1/5377/Bobra.0346s0040.1
MYPCTRSKTWRMGLATISRRTLKLVRSASLIRTRPVPNLARAPSCSDWFESGPCQIWLAQLDVQHDLNQARAKSGSYPSNSLSPPDTHLISVVGPVWPYVGPT